MTAFAPLCPSIRLAHKDSGTTSARLVAWPVVADLDCTEHSHLGRAKNGKV